MGASTGIVVLVREADIEVDLWVAVRMGMEYCAGEEDNHSEEEMVAELVVECKRCCYSLVLVVGASTCCWEECMHYFAVEGANTRYCFADVVHMPDSVVVVEVGVGGKHYCSGLTGANILHCCYFGVVGNFAVAEMTRMHCYFEEVRMDCWVEYWGSHSTFHISYHLIKINYNNE